MRDCERCERTHRDMETCPSQPGLCGLWREWFDGRRTPLHFIAVGLTPAIAILIAAATLAVLLH